MPIYDIFETKPQPSNQEKKTEGDQPILSAKDRFFSSLTARLLFLLLFLADMAWVAYSVVIWLSATLLDFVTFKQTEIFSQVARRQWVAVKRSLICGVSLFVALFSPALGIMIACTYFLMYDKMGIQEVVPSSLQEQFQEFIR